MKKPLFAVALFATLLFAVDKKPKTYLDIQYHSKNSVAISTFAFDKVFIDALPEASFVLDKTLAQTTITLDIACIAVDQMELRGKKYNVFTAKIGARLLITNSKQEILYIETIDILSDNGSSPANAELAALKKVQIAIQNLVQRDRKIILEALQSNSIGIGQ